MYRLLGLFALVLPFCLVTLAQAQEEELPPKETAELEEPTRPDRAIESVEKGTSTPGITLEEVNAKTPVAAQPGISKAIEKSQHGRNTALDRLDQRRFPTELDRDPMGSLGGGSRPSSGMGSMGSPPSGMGSMGGGGRPSGAVSAGHGRGR